MIISKKTVLVLLWLSCVFGLASCQKDEQFSLLNGQKRSIEDYRGQWLVINFWAEWCPPCLKEIPQLNLLAKNNPNIAVLGVSFDKLSNAELAGLVMKLNIEYPVLATEPMPYLPMARPQSLPATYVVTPQSEVLGPLLGEVDQEKILTIIEKIKASSGVDSAKD
ncbi:MAG: TlpA family protein disulfide reductase [Kangiellaceae bacterium]|nr:TlpA family protein disulfide reductase [Kangiellaceae bacterium]